MRTRRRTKYDPSKDRKLVEFLSELEIEEDKKDQIMEFIEKLAFEKVKEASVKPKQVLRLRVK